MESIGQTLKTARERRHISVADVVMATKMTSVFVKAIEADDFNALVAPVYARGFIKLYAACVGLDPMPLLKQFNALNRAAPVSVPPPPKASPRQAAEAYAEKLQPKSAPEKIGARSKAFGTATSAQASSLRALAPASLLCRPSSSSLSMLAGRLSALSRMFCAGVIWPWVKLPVGSAVNTVKRAAGLVFPRLKLPAIVWRRVLVVALFALLIIAASLAWDWSHRGLPSVTDACRWLAEPPAPYLNVEARAATVSR